MVLPVRQIAACATAALLAACGGGGGGSDAPSQSPANPPISGQPDSTYGTRGKVTFSPSGFFSSIAVLPDGSAYLAGLSVAKLDATGNRVQPYGDPPNERVGRSSAVVDATGSMYFITDDGRDRQLGKVDATGRTVPFNQLPQGLSPQALALGSDGGLYVASSPVPSPAGSVQYSMHVARLDSSGVLDPSFGLRMVHVGGNSAAPTALAFDRQGNIVVAGWAQIPNSPAPTFVVAKMSRSGEAVASFGAGGYRLGPACAASGLGLQDVAVDAAGNILVTSSCGALLFKLDARGDIITAFRDGGLRPGVLGVGPDGTPIPAQLLAVASGPDGAIYVAGTRYPLGGPTTGDPRAGACGDFAVAKLDSRGEMAAGFGDAGTFSFDGGFDTLNDFGIDGMGRLYALGHSSPCSLASSPTFDVVVRLLP